MFRSLKRYKTLRKTKKVKEGDGHPLKSYRLWDIFTRSLFYTELVDENNHTITYAVDFKFWVEEHKAELYRNGRHAGSSKLPAAFPVRGGVIEVGTGSYGINRMHVVTDEGNVYPLYPDKRSLRGLRLWLDRRFPRVSSFIGKLAVFILILSLLISLPQLLEMIFQIPWLIENIGEFHSPITLPAAVNFAIVGAGILAGYERSLTLRNHWLIDIETNYWDN